MSYDLNCPYCDAELHVCHDDGFGYTEGVKHEMQCSSCDKNFVFETSISFYYEPEKADCLNGDNHKYKPTNCYPKCFTKMQCSSCDDSRDLTDKERLELGIETIDEYYNALNQPPQ